MRSQRPWCSLFTALLLASPVVRAEAPIRLHASAAAARAIGGHQEKEFGWGVGVLPAVEYAITPALGIHLEPSVVWLSEGNAPSDPNLLPEGSGAAMALALGARLRPFATSHDATALSPAGFWLAASGGVATTNALVRPMVDAQMGYDFLLGAGRGGIGPMFGLYHVFQPDDEIRPADANLMLVGVHALLDFGPRKSERNDRDGDGIYDADDSCPDAPEDRDGFEDADGCPDLDDDKDGVPDVSDRCPRSPEDKDGFEDEDGCPELDNDRDGIPDPTDKCPLQAEDKDGFEDEDGCPDDDNDKDGIPDKEDLCPFEPETVNDYADSDGCPDEDQVRVVGDKIVLDDRVHFMVNSHIIRRVSYGLLEKLAKLIADHPEYVHISIEGHADQRGTDAFNQPLSERRAASVMEYLIKAGVPRSRLSSKGFGAQVPRSDQRTEFGYYENRRVEFIITRENRLGPKQAPPPATPPEPVGEDGPPPPDTPTPTLPEPRTPPPPNNETSPPTTPAPTSPVPPSSSAPPAPPAPAPKGGQP